MKRMNSNGPLGMGDTCSLADLPRHIKGVSSPQSRCRPQRLLLQPPRCAVSCYTTPPPQSNPTASAITTLCAIVFYRVLSGSRNSPQVHPQVARQKGTLLEVQHRLHAQFSLYRDSEWPHLSPTISTFIITKSPPSPRVHIGPSCIAYKIGRQHMYGHVQRQ
jgi:hypothetical protein